MEDQCCSELQGCAPGTDCDALLACAQACAMDSACVDGCINDHSQGLTDFQTLQGCYDTSCKNTAECVYPICDSTLVFPDQACAECMSGTACCASATSCVADTDCTGCLSDSTGAACATNVPYLEVDSCLHDGDKCGKLCTFGICDSGLGYPSLPACNFCLGQADASGGCCEQTSACQADADCLDCITGVTSGAACANNALFTAFTMCRADKCAADCGG